jgi:hypothetical protein
MIREAMDEKPNKENMTCQGCGEPVRVWVMQGYRRGKPVMGKFCMSCSDQLGLWFETDKPGREKERLGMDSLFIILGLLVGILGIIGDHVGIRGFIGLAWHQQIGFTLGALLVIIGILFRIDLVVVVGAVVFVFSAFSDTLGLVGSNGFGWKQEFAVLAGLVMILIGLRRSAVKFYQRKLV